MGVTAQGEKLASVERVLLKVLAKWAASVCPLAEELPDTLQTGGGTAQ